MNFIANESSQKLRGGFYTHPDIAKFLTRWALENRPEKILEPSCGDGVFIAAASSTLGSRRAKIVAFEIDEGEASKANFAIPPRRRLDVTIHVGDYLEQYLIGNSDLSGIDAVVGNPPFIRYQYLGEKQQALAERVFSKHRLSFTKHTNAWVPFIVASIDVLRPSGRLAMVVPSELLHIPHARSLRGYLASQCSRVMIVDPEELFFGDVLQGVQLLMAEKKSTRGSKSYGVAIRPVRTRADLSVCANEIFDKAEYVNGSSIEGKWMQVLLTNVERALLNGIKESEHVDEFKNVASVDVGIVTGANKFFLVSDAVVDAFALHQWAHPMFGRSEHVDGVVYSRADHLANRRAGLPANFLWFDASDICEFPKTVQKYLRSGEHEGLHTRYKCRVRNPWYRVPSVHTTSVAMLKRAHHFHRLVLNKADAFTTDTAYRVRPRNLSAESLVYSFLNSLTCLSAELEGRHYGGGVLELVPSEIEQLILPKYSVEPSKLRDLDKKYRQIDEDAAILRAQDHELLEHCGVSKTDCVKIHEAWDRLRKRRQRVV